MKQTYLRPWGKCYFGNWWYILQEKAMYEFSHEDFHNTTETTTDVLMDDDCWEFVMVIAFFVQLSWHFFGSQLPHTTSNASSMKQHSNTSRLTFKRMYMKMLFLFLDYTLFIILWKPKAKILIIAALKNIFVNRENEEVQWLFFAAKKLRLFWTYKCFKCSFFMKN